MARAVFRLVLPQAPWLACLAELRECYADAFRRSGCATTLSDFYVPDGPEIQVAFGAHVVPPPPGCVVFNSEHHGHHFTPEYRKTLAGASLVVNMGPFPARAEASVEIPPGIMSEDAVNRISPLEATGREYGLVFYGSLTPRRAQILESLQGAGVDVVALYGVLGKARDRYIDRAKVVLDLKQDGEEPPDATRVFWSLSRGACTLSESAPEGNAALVTPADVVAKVKVLVSDADLRGGLHRAYAEALGPCNVEPLLSALGV